MSVAAVKWAIDQKVGDVTAKSVLVILAWHHNPENGLCCPSIPTLQAECDIKSDNTVKSALKRLAALGLISSERDIVNGSIKRTRYTLSGFDPSVIEGGAVNAGGSAIEGGAVIDPPLPQDLTPPSRKDCPSLPQNLPPKEKIEKVEREETTDIRPKLSDTAETVEDFGLEVETLKSEPPTFEEKGVDRTPVKFIVDTYNEVLGGVLGKVLKVTPARQQAMRNRYRDIYRDCECLNDEEAKDKVRKFFVCISRSDFLMGRTGRQGNHAAWMPNFDWLMQQKNYTKILEGVYDNGKR